MLKLSATLLLISIAIFQCSSNHIKTDKIKTSSNSSIQSQSPISICGLDGFTRSEAEHIIDEIKQPFVVQIIKGKIINSDDYGWAKDVRVLFEIRGIEKDRQTQKIYADENGDFAMNNIPEGQYCFKATVLGWQSVMGIIMVDKKADPKKEIEFTMRLGV